MQLGVKVSYFDWYFTVSNNIIARFIYIKTLGRRASNFTSEYLNKRRVMQWFSRCCRRLYPDRVSVALILNIIAVILLTTDCFFFFFFFLT